MLCTMVTQSRAHLDCHITGHFTEKESYLKSVTFYTVETSSSLTTLYEVGKLYKVNRRFNDFKKLYHALREVEEYRGFSIPPLPEDATSYSSYLVHNDDFLKERMQKLDSFLRLLTAHDTIR